VAPPESEVQERDDQNAARSDSLRRVVRDAGEKMEKRNGNIAAQSKIGGNRLKKKFSAPGDQRYPEQDNDNKKEEDGRRRVFGGKRDGAENKKRIREKTEEKRNCAADGRLPRWR